jgi:LysM repeat protein
MGLDGSLRDREEDEWPETPPRRERPRSRRSARRSPAKRLGPALSRRAREMLTLIGINAALSLLISLTVVVVWDALVRAPAATPAPVVAVTDTPTPMPARPMATFTPGPGEPTVYRVQPGDSLLTIAVRFDVTVEDIMAANGLTNPDFIQVGQELLIPVGGLPAPTPTATPVMTAVEPPPPTDTPGPTTLPQPPTETPTDTPTPLPITPPATEPEVIVREILGAGVLAEEAAFVFNSGRAVRLEGWTLSDAQGNVYTFPNLFLGTGGGVRVHTGSGSNSATDLYWGLDAPVWGEPGDVATLRDESGLVIGAFALP